MRQRAARRLLREEVSRAHREYHWEGRCRHNRNPRSPVFRASRDQQTRGNANNPFGSIQSLYGEPNGVLYTFGPWFSPAPTFPTMAMRTYAITESPTDKPKTQYLFIILSGLYPINLKIYIISTIFFEIFRVLKTIFQLFLHENQCEYFFQKP